MSTIEPKTLSLPEALRAQKALRDMAGLEEERFPVEAFVGMISDEIETLRSQGRTDEEIAGAIQSVSAIPITAQELRENYAPAELRHGNHS